MGILKWIKRLRCRHDGLSYYVMIARGKYVNIKKGGHLKKLRYDVMRERHCYECDKLIEQTRVKYHLTQPQMEMFFEHLK